MWPALSHDLNPIENLWSIFQKKICEGEWKYSSKQATLGEATLASSNNTFQFVGNDNYFDFGSFLLFAPVGKHKVMNEKRLVLPDFQG